MIINFIRISRPKLFGGNFQAIKIVIMLTGFYRRLPVNKTRKNVQVYTYNIKSAPAKSNHICV